MVTGGEQALDGRGEARVLCSLLPNREVPLGTLPTLSSRCSQAGLPCR